MTIFQTTETATSIFGEGARAYGRILTEIAPFIVKERYRFEDLDEFVAKAHAGDDGWRSANKIYWVEILYRAHMSAVAALSRSSRWIDAAAREYEAGNIFGWSAACRSFIESAGDTAHSLANVPLNLAQHHRQISNALTARDADGLMTSKELEDALIHFTHGRKVLKGDEAPDSHKAKRSSDYVDSIDRMDIEGVKDLYAMLCEIVHPASSTVAILFAHENGEWMVSRGQEEKRLKETSQLARPVLGNVMMAAFNPPLLILRVLHRFKIFSNVPPLRKYQLNAPVWTKIEAALRS